MDETTDDLVHYLLDGLKPGETLLEGAFQLLWLLLGDNQAVQGILDLIGIKVEACILDTNRLLNELKFLLKKERQPSLLLGAKLGGVKIFAAVSVRDEMPRKIGELMAGWHVDPAVALSTWETQFAPWIHFVDLSELPPLSEKVEILQRRDATDVQTGQLIELLRPHAVLSSDRDLAAFGTLAWDTAILTCAYYDKGKREVIIIHLNVAAFLTLRVLEAVLSPFLSWLSRVDKRILLSTLLSLTAGFGLAMLYTPTRKWLLEQYQTLASRVKPVLLDLCNELQPPLDNYRLISQEAREATHTIEQLRRSSDNPKIVLEYASKVLATAPGPLAITEVSQLMREYGYKPKGAHPETYLRRILRAYPGLYSVDEYKRWSLKRHRSA